MNPYDLFLVLTIAAIGALGIVIGYAIAERDRPDETFPDEPFPDETLQRDPRPDDLLPQPRPQATPSSGRSR